MRDFAYRTPSQPSLRPLLLSSFGPSFDRVPFSQVVLIEAVLSARSLFRGNALARTSMRAIRRAYRRPHTGLQRLPVAPPRLPFSLIDFKSLDFTLRARSGIIYSVRLIIFARLMLLCFSLRVRVLDNKFLPHVNNVFALRSF
ncbi:hypothetical protein PUN28_018161 [Cardiocondyla obscurior]|uniref:Uncharacterized protein n=1 Tax=Cardiocondyla obscurior TaxID=286306 RepID=A0AAW2EK11_9HYME